jgi:hypothetical protein
MEATQPTDSPAPNGAQDPLLQLAAECYNEGRGEAVYLLQQIANEIKANHPETTTFLDALVLAVNMTLETMPMTAEILKESRLRRGIALVSSPFV